MITFTVPGPPKGQPRPRATTINGKARMYESEKGRSWKQVIASWAIHYGVRQIIGPVGVLAIAYLPRPKRLCRKSDPPGAIWSEVKPDFDNIAKAVCDALNGIAYADDKSVVFGACLKAYHEKGGMPRTDMTIFPMGAITVDGLRTIMELLPERRAM